jgi:hypothetical protein
METVMNKHHELIERWGAALMGTVLVALPVAGWIHEASWTSVSKISVGLSS